MTKEEIINIAWNIFPISDREKNEAFIELLVHFAQAIAEKEREECAEAVEGYRKQRTHETWYKAEEQIRSRGQE
jgi:uncharacterized protein YbgA (DUF1722 family)